VACVTSGVRVSPNVQPIRDYIELLEQGGWRLGVIALPFFQSARGLVEAFFPARTAAVFGGMTSVALLTHDISSHSVILTAGAISSPAITTNAASIRSDVGSRRARCDGRCVR
jgi:hypothetical protein